MKNQNSLKKTARTAGVLYLALGLTGMFGLLYVPSQIYVHTNASETAANIMNSDLLYRFGIFFNLVCPTIFVFLVLQLDRLFRGVNEYHSRLMVALVIVSIPISFVVVLNQIAPLVLLSGADFLNGMDSNQLEALSMMFIKIYDHGIMVVEIFWGLWLFPFGYLIYRSGFIPKIFGILLMIACFGYLINSFTGLVFPDQRNFVIMFTSITGTVGEFAIIFWLLIKGVNNKNASQIAAY